MIEHNVVVVGGVEYKAVKGEKDSCHGCAAYNNRRLCHDLGKCNGSLRGDRVDVKYKRHYRPKCDELQIKAI